MTQVCSGGPTQLFFSTREQRLALARERFFEQGLRPSGLVSDCVIQSWYRCMTAGQRGADRLQVEAASKLRIESALRQSRQLLEASALGLDGLEAVIAGTACQVVLTNPEGLIIYASRRVAQAGERVMPAVARLGVDLSESVIGTSAPGIVAKTGQGCSLHGEEHFNDAVRAVHCAAAPIRDIDGALAGVLDLSIEGRAFGFDAFALIKAYASMIENSLLVRQSQDLLLLAFQVDPQLLGTPMQALMAVGGDGRLRWLNDAAAGLTAGRAGQPVEQVWGCTLGALLGLLTPGPARRVRLPNGLQVWVQARLQTGPGEPDAEPTTASIARPAEPARPAATLQAAQAEQVAKALQACGGKVARAARVLGVSRGLIYRHLHKASDP